jgi:hypothetical protein
MLTFFIPMAERAQFTKIIAASPGAREPLVSDRHLTILPATGGFGLKMSLLVSKKMLRSTSNRRLRPAFGGALSRSKKSADEHRCTQIKILNICVHPCLSVDSKSYDLQSVTDCLMGWRFVATVARVAGTLSKGPLIYSPLVIPADAEIQKIKHLDIIRMGVRDKLR